MNTKKDFIRAAKLVSQVRERDEDAEDAQAMENVFVVFFASDNPRFDEKRFREACK